MRRNVCGAVPCEDNHQARIGHAAAPTGAGLVGDERALWKNEKVL